MANYLAQKNDCCGCGACENACPSSAIVMEYDSEGFIYPSLLEDKCLDCKACDRVCPVKEKNIGEYKPYLKTFAGYSLKDEIMNSCTSGGFATTISQLIIKEGGVVFGVTYAEDYVKAKYVCVTESEELKALMSSKYVQSEKGDVFKAVKEALKKDVSVLFVGCPCDVAGLKLFLGNEYENLYTCELVCMGVTSYKIAEEYKAYSEKKNKSKLTYINARSKKNGWFVPHLEERFENGKTKLTTLFGSYYGYGFQVYNRHSCFNCKYRDINGVADIRVGDFWGIKETDEFWNPNGVSCIFARTERGLELISRLEKEEFKLFETSYEKATKNNMSSTQNKQEKYVNLRERFATTYQKHGLIKACKKTETFSVKLKRIMPKGMRAFAKKLYHKLHDKKTH